MSLFDSASLVVTPNGYKEDKLYSIKPTDGSGDLVVTRATTATRVNSDGLIEQVPYNLLQQSQTFDNATWTKIRSSITANSIIAPNGTLTADTFTYTDDSGSDGYISQNVTLSGEDTIFSIYVKTGTFSVLQLANATTGKGMSFDISNKTTSSFLSAPIDFGFLEDTNGYSRIFIKTNSSVGVNVFRIYLSESKGAVLNSSVYLWGAQLVSGTSAKEYFPTTDRLDVPRLDYTNSTCPSILVEPQRTNVYLNSDNFSVSDGISGCAITSNVEISPDGTMNADKIQGDGSVTTFQVFNNITIAASTIYTFSVFAKAGNTNFMQLTCNLMDIETNAVFDVSLGTITSIGTNSNPTITDYGNGWYRCSINMVAQTTDLSGRFRIYVPADGSGAAWVGSASNGKNIFLYGRQLEAGSNATSYVPTVASSVTRNADVISKTGISSLIGQTEGTIYAEVNIKNWETSTRVLGISDGTFDNRIIILQNSSNRLRALITNVAVLQTDINTSTLTNGVYKIAIGYKANDVVFYVNGVLIGSDNSVSIPACSAVYLGKNENSDSTNFLNNRINSALIFKERLTNEQLAQLTTI